MEEKGKRKSSLKSDMSVTIRDYHDCLTFIAQLHNKVHRIYTGGGRLPQMQKLM